MNTVAEYTSKTSLPDIQASENPESEMIAAAADDLTTPCPATLSTDKCETAPQPPGDCNDSALRDITRRVRFLENEIEHLRSRRQSYKPALQVEAPHSNTHTILPRESIFDSRFFNDAFAANPTAIRIESDRWIEYRSQRTIPAEHCIIICGSRKKASSSLESGSHAISDDEETSSLSTSTYPERIAIGSGALLQEIEKITCIKIPHITNVFLWPFKLLVRNETKIRARLAKLDVQLKDTPQLPDATLTSSQKLKTMDGEVSHGVVMTREENTEKVLIESRTFELETEDLERTRRLRDELQCLVDFMDNELGDIFHLLKQIKEGKAEKVAFDELWYLFRPGDLVISHASPKHIYSVLHVTGGRPALSVIRDEHFTLDYGVDDDDDDVLNSTIYDPVTPFVLDCFSLDCNGTSFGPVFKRIWISPYEENCMIKSLKVYPVQFCESQDLVSLELRGQQYTNLCEGHAAFGYDGHIIDVSTLAEDYEQINTEVIIDLQTGYKISAQHENTKIPLFRRGSQFTSTKADRREIIEDVQGSELMDNFDDSIVDIKERAAVVTRTNLLKTTFINAVGNQFTSHHYLLMPAYAYGYILASHRWALLRIDCLVPISWDTVAFDELVLPENHRALLKAVVASHFKTREKRLDTSTAGSKQGTNILLHGAPGVGKTSTAESIASLFKRPLFKIFPGNLTGGNAREVSATLATLFELAERWGCILLLDEADVYLSSRHSGDVKDNSLISVFLKALDSYPGIMFLTTNRVGQFDEATKSRIHVSLYYPSLDERSSLSVWTANLRRMTATGLSLSSGQRNRILRFAKRHFREGYQWNGRQIRNAVQTAASLALAEEDTEDGPTLTVEHVRKVATMNAHFDSYLIQVRGATDGDLALRYGLRMDNFEDPHTEPQSKRGSRRDKYDGSPASKSKWPASRKKALRRYDSDASDDSDDSSEPDGTVEDESST